MSTNDHRKWKPCDRPLSSAERAFMRDLQARESVQARTFALPVDEEMGVRESARIVSVRTHKT